MENIMLRDKPLENNLVVFTFIIGRNVIKCVEVENIRTEIQSGHRDGSVLDVCRRIELVTEFNGEDTKERNIMSKTSHVSVPD